MPLASIPSPDKGVVYLGPLPIRAYGLFIAVGVLVALWLSERRWKARGGDPKVIGDLAVWTIIGGVIGARAYHVISDNQLFRDDWAKAFRIWEGGLSIWGAVMGGLLALAIVARVRRLPLLLLMDTLGPTVLVAQAIGRWGNYFNQELFGRPTNLPWGLEIDLDKRPPGYVGHETFHPTFLYECLSNLALYGIILLVERRFRLRQGQTFSLYVTLYCFMRFWYENLRIDPANTIGGLRVNAWVSLVLFAGGLVAFVLLGRRGRPWPESVADLGLHPTAIAEARPGDASHPA